MEVNQQAADTMATMAAKAAPPIAVVSANIAGWPVPDLVQWITLAYVFLMFCHKAWQMGWGAYKFWVLKQRDDKSE